MPRFVRLAALLSTLALVSCTPKTPANAVTRFPGATNEGLFNEPLTVVTDATFDVDQVPEGEPVIMILVDRDDPANAEIAQKAEAFAMECALGHGQFVGVAFRDKVPKLLSKRTSDPGTWALRIGHRGSDSELKKPINWTEFYKTFNLSQLPCPARP